jgi:hypothetical protein
MLPATLFPKSGSGNKHLLGWLALDLNNRNAARLRAPGGVSNEWTDVCLFGNAVRALARGVLRGFNLLPALADRRMVTFPGFLFIYVPTAKGRLKNGSNSCSSQWGRTVRMSCSAKCSRSEHWSHWPAPPHGSFQQW